MGPCGRLGQQHCCCMADSFLAIRTDGSGWEGWEGWERMGMMRRDGRDGRDGNDGSGWGDIGGDGREKERNLIIFVTGSEIKGKKR